MGVFWEEGDGAVWVGGEEEAGGGGGGKGSEEGGVWKPTIKVQKIHSDTCEISIWDLIASLTYKVIPSTAKSA